MRGMKTGMKSKHLIHICRHGNIYLTVSRMCLETGFIFMVHTITITGMFSVLAIMSAGLLQLMNLKLAL